MKVTIRDVLVLIGLVALIVLYFYSNNGGIITIGMSKSDIKRIIKSNPDSIHHNNNGTDIYYIHKNNAMVSIEPIKRYVLTFKGDTLIKLGEN